MSRFVFNPKRVSVDPIANPLHADTEDIRIGEAVVGPGNKLYYKSTTTGNPIILLVDPASAGTTYSQTQVDNLIEELAAKTGFGSTHPLVSRLIEDFNTVDQVGTYYFDNTTSNNPVGSVYGGMGSNLPPAFRKGILRVYAIDGGKFLQEAVVINDKEGSVTYTRVGSNGNWEADGGWFESNPYDLGTRNLGSEPYLTLYGQNADNVVNPGVYLTNTSTTNVPTTETGLPNSYSILEVFRYSISGTTTILQNLTVMSDFDSRAGKTYSRAKQGSAWTNWNDFDDQYNLSSRRLDSAPFSILYSNNLNNVNVAGIYTVTAATTNVPTTTYGIDLAVLEVFTYSDNDYSIHQRLTLIAGTANNDGDTYHRSYRSTNSTWGTWIRVLNDQNLSETLPPPVVIPDEPRNRFKYVTSLGNITLEAPSSTEDGYLHINGVNRSWILGNSPTYTLSGLASGINIVHYLWASWNGTSIDLTTSSVDITDCASFTEYPVFSSNGKYVQKGNNPAFTLVGAFRTITVNTIFDGDFIPFYVSPSGMEQLIYVYTAPGLGTIPLVSGTVNIVNLDRLVWSESLCNMAVKYTTNIWLDGGTETATYHFESRLLTGSSYSDSTPTAILEEDSRLVVNSGNLVAVPGTGAGIPVLLSSNRVNNNDTLNNCFGKYKPSVRFINTTIKVYQEVLVFSAGSSAFIEYWPGTYTSFTDTPHPIRIMN